jgi:hypothetical protein
MNAADLADLRRVLVIVQSPCAQPLFQSFLSAPLSPDTACATEARPRPFAIVPD